MLFIRAEQKGTEQFCTTGELPASHCKFVDYSHHKGDGEVKFPCKTDRECLSNKNPLFKNRITRECEK